MSASAPAPVRTSVYAMRDIESLDEFVQVEDVQREAWGFADKEIVPQSILLAIRNAGGAV